MEESTKKSVENGILRVGSRTPVKDLAMAIAATLKEEGFVELRAIGDGAIGHAVRAVIIARGLTVTAGIDLVCIPSFFMTMIDGNEKTGVKIILEDR